MTDLHPRDPRLTWLVAAFAVALTIVAAALSFTVLQDIARQVGIPAGLAVLFPMIVDTAAMGVLIAGMMLSDRRRRPSAAQTR